MTGRIIEATGLRCAYGTFEAVRGIDFHVGEGELVALLGTNGAGKTTTVETLEGMRRPTAGEVRVLGRDPFRQRSKVRPRMGIMLQESGFAGDLTVAETVLLWQDLSSRTSDADEALHLLDLAHRRDVRVSQLSGGERRRLDLLLATLGRPDVLFLDEPTTGLDPESRKAAWELIRGLIADGATILLTTHYLEEAESLADRLAIMHEGRIAVSGTIAEVLGGELATIGFDLAGSVAVALPTLKGDVEVSDGRVRIRTPDLQRDLADVLGWADTHGVELVRLRAQHASLDEVFHRVVDRDATETAPTGKA